MRSSPIVAKSSPSIAESAPRKRLLPETPAMIVSEKSNASGEPYVIHNIGAGTQEEDRLFEFKITGHYRLPAK